MTIVKVRANNKITIPNSMIEKLNMNDTEHVYFTVHDSETFSIKKQLNESDLKSFFIGPRLLSKCFNKKSYVNYCVSIPTALMREMLSVKIGDYVYVYIKENENIVVTTKFSKKGE